ncbi:class I SAM-dependent methyltransferase [Streptomyces sp. NPDC014676]|uniref:class I SAM-dependent methyltransferase n=1 Tax=Streptomyces sp. NPDC014676 TaxID=3364879 RepID=UPI0036F8926D
MHSDASNDSAQDFYRGLGAHYEAITRVQDYARWARLYRDLLERHAVPGHRLLDVGCGTGKSALELARLGFTVTGIGLSPEMIEAARHKDGADQVVFVTADARSLPALGTFDAVVTMGEPLTYLPGEEQLARVFPGVRRSLRAGGLFLFDLPTAGFQDRAAARQTIDETDGMVVLTRGRSADPTAHTTELTVDLFTATGRADTWSRVQERALLHWFAPQRVTELLTAHGFAVERIYGLYDGELMEQADQDLHRKYFVLARALPPADHADA